MITDTMRSLIEKTCKRFGIKKEDLISKSRKRELVYARIRIAVIMHDNGLSFSEIGRLIGRDHSTVSHYLETFRNWERMNQLPDEFKDLSYE